MKRDQSRPEWPGPDSLLEIRIKGPVGPVRAIAARLKLSLTVLSESENCPNRTGQGVRRYLRVEPVGDRPTRCQIRLVPAGQAEGEACLALCGEVPLRQVGELINALVQAAARLAGEEPQAEPAGRVEGSPVNSNGQGC